MYITERQAAKRKDRINSLGGIMKRGKAECLDMDYIPIYIYFVLAQISITILLWKQIPHIHLFSFMVQQ